MERNEKMKRSTIISAGAALIISIYLLTYLTSDTDGSPTIFECRDFVIKVIGYVKNMIC